MSAREEPDQTDPGRRRAAGRDDERDGDDESPHIDPAPIETAPVEPAPIAARPEHLKDALPGAGGGPDVTPGEADAPVPPG